MGNSLTGMAAKGTHEAQVPVTFRTRCTTAMHAMVLRGRYP